MGLLAPYRVTVTSTCHFSCSCAGRPKERGLWAEGLRQPWPGACLVLTWFDVGISVGAIQNRELHQLHLLQAVLSFCLYVENTRVVRTWDGPHTSRPIYASLKIVCDCSHLFWPRKEDQGSEGSDILKPVLSQDTQLPLAASPRVAHTRNRIPE